MHFDQCVQGIVLAQIAKFWTQKCHVTICRRLPFCWQYLGSPAIKNSVQSPDLSQLLFADHLSHDFVCFHGPPGRNVSRPLRPLLSVFALNTEHTFAHGLRDSEQRKSVLSNKVSDFPTVLAFDVLHSVPRLCPVVTAANNHKQFCRQFANALDGLMEIL